MNICLEINENYEQLSSTISKFQVLFSKILFEHFPAMFGALFGEFSSAIGTCLSLNHHKVKQHIDHLPHNNRQTQARNSFFSLPAASRLSRVV